MNEDFEWDRFQQEATQQVRAGIGEERGSKRIFQFLILTSFNSVVGWEVLKRHDRKSETAVPFAVRSEWDRRADWARLEECKKLQPPVARPRALKALTPTHHRRTVSVEAGALETFLTDLNDMSIPPFAFEYPVGCDGTGYELTFGQHFLCAEYCWWEQGPEAWRPLIEQTMAFVEWLEKQPASGGTGDSAKRD